MIKTYNDLDILLTKKARGFEARIINSPAGQAHCQFDMPTDTDVLTQCITQHTRSFRTFDLDDSPISKEATCSIDVIKETGATLFNAIFKGDTLDCLEKSLYHTNKKGLRIRLHFSNDLPELATLPWEYLYDEKEARFLALSVKTPIVRYPELMSTCEPVAIELPLYILVVISSPIDLPSLAVETEWNNLKESLRSLEKEGLVVIKRLQNATIESLQYELQSNQYHILHYIGHSDFDVNIDNAVLLFEDKQGKSNKIEAESFGKLLRDIETMRLVVLNSCEGGQTSSSVFFSGLALSLIKKHIPVVIAMQFEITDAAAIIFSHDFYHALANKYPVEAALSEARKAIDIRLNHIEWGTPTLYMCSSSGQLFSPESSRENKIIHTLIDKTSVTEKKKTTSYILIASIITLLVYIFQSLNSQSPVTPPLDKSLIVAGFNCDKARTVTEKAICSSVATASADKYLNKVYTNIYKKLPPPLAEELSNEQNEWLYRRDRHIEQNCISLSGDVKKDCIIDYYNKHSRVLLQKGNLLNPKNFRTMLVIDPPSNVRDKPNGKVVCQVKTKKRISVYMKPEISSNGSRWYWTRVCGKWALIHKSQLEDSGFN